VIPVLILGFDNKNVQLKRSISFPTIVTNQTILDMTGIQLAREEPAVRPDVQLAISTGFSSLALVLTAF
jgi:hypothetical protein